MEDPRYKWSIAAPKKVRQRVLVKDVQVQGFYDLMVQVIKMYPLDGRMTLYVTDYTEHTGNYNHQRDRNDLAAELVARDGDEFGYSAKSNPKLDKSWNGPWGKLTLQLTLYNSTCSLCPGELQGGRLGAN